MTDWISVKDRLPEWAEDGYYYPVLGWYLNRSVVEVPAREIAGNTDKYTHWMPMPAPPEQEITP